MTTTVKMDLWRGMIAGLPFVIVIGPFALLFGVVGTEAGLNIAEVMGFSVLVIAGASQFAALQLMEENAPTVIILATALAVNLRMAMYSAALVPYLGQASLLRRALAAYFLVDQSFSVAYAKFENDPEMSVANRYAFFFGVMIPVCPCWYALTLIGAIVGKRIPPEFALDFAVPITFLAIVAPMLRTLAHVVAAFTSIVLALLFKDLPFSSGLLVAAFFAMIAGAATETWMKRRS
ncbi:MAG: AzlC family ABC transporter permease [Pseudomonadota bacterium]